MILNGRQKDVYYSMDKPVTPPIPVDFLVALCLENCYIY